MAAAFKQFQRVQPQSGESSSDAQHAGETA
jgi:hypothetical protein